jgi:hypothetical protein
VAFFFVLKLYYHLLLRAIHHLCHGVSRTLIWKTCVFSAPRTLRWFQMVSRFWDLYVGTRRSPRYIPWYVTLLTHLPYVTRYTLCTQTSKIIPYFLSALALLALNEESSAKNAPPRHWIFMCRYRKMYYYLCPFFSPVIIFTYSCC